MHFVKMPKNIIISNGVSNIYFFLFKNYKFILHFFIYAQVEFVYVFKDTFLFLKK